MNDNNKNPKMSNAKRLISMAASLAASTILIQRILSFSRSFYSQITIVIEENPSNQLFEAANIYFSTKIAPSNHRIKVSKTEEEGEFAVMADRDDPAIDVYEGVQVQWSLVCKPAVESSGPGSCRSELRRRYELSFNERHRERVLDKYLPYILQTAMPTITEEREKKIEPAAPAAAMEKSDWKSSIVSSDWGYKKKIEPAAPAAVMEKSDWRSSIVSRDWGYKITKRMPDTKTLLSGVASVAASAMLIRTISNDFFPNEIRNYFASSIHNIYRQFSSQLTIVIEELQGLQTNQVFEAAHCYLGTKMTPSVQRIKVTKAEEEKKLLVHADRGEEILDTFEDFDVKWTLVCTQIEVRNFSHRRVSNASMQSEKRSYELTFNKKNKEKVLNSYLPFIIEKSKAIKEETKIVKFHTIEHRNWQSNAINLDHPMTFNTLAMDSTLKKELIDDLNHFIQSKDFYKRVGKAWKRGYLLYGPPGTGKSSLIAAMANHLNFDIYDLDLTNVHFNNELRPLLLSMKNRSILVVEDIDCSIKLQNRELGEEEPANGKNEVTLSGLLNIIDGLLSCCGEQRIIVFTTNRKEKLDLALLRPGRMDMHIHMSYCRISAFKQLALNYLGIHKHQNFERIQQLLEKVEVTPAEVAGELMKSNDVQVSLQGLVQFLVNKEKVLTL